MGDNTLGQFTRPLEPKTGRKERTKKSDSAVGAEAKSSAAAADSPKCDIRGDSAKATIETNGNTKENCESGGEHRSISKSDPDVNSTQASGRYDQPTTDIISKFQETNGRQRSSESRQKPRKKPAPTSKAPAANGAAKATRSRANRQLASSSFNGAFSSNESNCSPTTTYQLLGVSNSQNDSKCALDSHFHIPPLEPECQFALFKPNSQAQTNDDDHPSTDLDHDYQAYYNRGRRELYYQIPSGAARDHQVYNMSRHAHNSEDNYHTFREENGQESASRNGNFKEKQQSQIHGRFDYNERIISSPKDPRSFQRISSENQLVDQNYEMSNVDRNYALRGDEQEFMSPIENYQYKSSDGSPQSQMKHSYYSSDPLQSPEYYHAGNFAKDQQPELRYRRLSSSMAEDGSSNAKKHKYMAQDHSQFAIGYSNRHQFDSSLNLNLADGPETKSSGKSMVKNGSGDDSPIAFSYRKNSLPLAQSSPQMPESSILLNKGNYGNMQISGDIYSRQRDSSSQTSGVSDQIIYGCEQPLPQTNYHYYAPQAGSSAQNFAKFSQDVVINDGIVSLSDLANQRDMIYVDPRFSPSNAALSKQPARNSINNLDGLTRPLMSVDKAARGDDLSPTSAYVKFNTSGDLARNSSNVEQQQQQQQRHHHQHREPDKKLASTKPKSRNDAKASSNSNDNKMDEQKRKQLRRANNRAAAAKCRQKKNDTITKLNDANEKLKLINSQMSRALTVCTSQRNYLLEQIKNHCGCEALQINPQIQELIEMTLNVENGLDFGLDYRMAGGFMASTSPEMDMKHFESRGSNMISNSNAGAHGKLPTTIDYFANEDDMLSSAQVNANNINSNGMSAMMQRERNQIELMNQNKALLDSAGKMKHAMQNSASKCDNNIFSANERPASGISPSKSGFQLRTGVDRLQAQNRQESIRPLTDGDKITTNANQSNNMQSPRTPSTLDDSKDIRNSTNLVDGQEEARESPYRLLLDVTSPSPTSMTLNSFQIDGFGSTSQNRSANVDRDAASELRASPPPQLSIN